MLRRTRLPPGLYFPQLTVYEHVESHYCLTSISIHTGILYSSINRSILLRLGLKCNYLLQRLSEVVSWNREWTYGRHKTSKAKTEPREESSLEAADSLSVKHFFLFQTLISLKSRPRIPAHQTTTFTPSAVPQKQVPHLVSSPSFSFRRLFTHLYFVSTESSSTLSIEPEVQLLRSSPVWYSCHIT